MKKALVCLIVIVAAPLAASAASIAYSVQYETTFASNATLSTTDGGIGDKSVLLFSSWSNPAGYNTHWIHRFAIYFSVSGMAVGQDVNQIAYGISGGVDGRVGQNFGLSSGGLTLTTKGGFSFVANKPSYAGPDPNATDPDGNRDPNYGRIAGSLGTVGDLATAGDLRGLYLNMSAAVAWGQQHQADYIDPDTAQFQTDSVGNPTWMVPGTGTVYGANYGPEISVQMLGWVFVAWDGTSQGSSLSVFADPRTGSTWNCWLDNQNGTGSEIDAPWPNTVGYSPVFGAVPEPASMVLLALGGLGLLRRRRWAM